jgi:hypothetical protein
LEGATVGYRSLQDLGSLQHMAQEPAIVFCLIDRILETCRESGATLEESVAALKASQEIVPLIGLQSKNNITIQT